nr:hypothetical protein [Actinomadura decatromicini]
MPSAPTDSEIGSQAHSSRPRTPRSRSSSRFTRQVSRRPGGRLGGGRRDVREPEPGEDGGQPGAHGGEPERPGRAEHREQQPARRLPGDLRARARHREQRAAEHVPVAGQQGGQPGLHGRAADRREQPHREEQRERRGHRRLADRQDGRDGEPQQVERGEQAARRDAVREREQQRSAHHVREEARREDQRGGDGGAGPLERLDGQRQHPDRVAAHQQRLQGEQRPELGDGEHVPVPERVLDGGGGGSGHEGDSAARPPSRDNVSRRNET